MAIDTARPDGGHPAVPLLYIVLPCYNEEAVLPLTAKRLHEKLDELVAAEKVSPQSRAVFVDDGSSDATWQIIEGLHGDPSNGSYFCGIKLAHNRGHQNALICGLMEVREWGCDAVVSMDADLQHDPDAIDDMLVKYHEGCEIVNAVRNDRDTDSWFKRTTAEGFYGLMTKMGAEIIPNSADFRLLSAEALDALAEYGEENIFLRGMIPMLGYKSDIVHYEVAERAAGESKYPASKMIAFAIEGITSLSTKPIRLITTAGVITVIFSLAMLVYVIVSLASGHVVAGWSSLLISIWLVGGMIMISLGIVGEYVGKIYLEAKHRPRYRVERRLR